MQLDLFGDRYLQLAQARRKLAEGRAGDARRELDRLHSYYPEDPGIAAELDLARTLEQRLDEIAAVFPGERPRLLLTAARAAPAELRGTLLRRAAEELRQAAGPAALLDGKPASRLLLDAGDLQGAWAAADEAARHCPRARFRSYLADVEHRLGRQSRARMRYREALALDPYDVDWDELADDEVTALPDIARTELAFDDGVAWVAPAGVVLGVLPLGEPPPATALGDGGDPAPAALAHARAFLRALADATRERGAGAIDARRQMRSLAPQLLAAWLARR